MKRWTLIGLVMIMTLCLAGTGWTADEANKPERGLVASLIYPGVTITPDEKIRVDIVVKNTGRSAEMIMLDVIEAPKDWETMIKGFGKVVSGIFLTSGEDKTLTFMVNPPEGKKKYPLGDFNFKIKATTRDGALSQVSSMRVTVKPKTAADQPLKLTTSYPVLRGPTDTSFEFSLDIRNQADEDKLINLSSGPIKGWDVSFKPSYENKQISSFKLKASQSKTVAVKVKPDRNAKAGRYPIKVTVKTDVASEDAVLTVVLTGTNKIKAGTTTGLLSLTTQVGAPANMSFYVRNEGSAVQKQVKFMSFKPENWQVEFNPKEITDLQPGALKQVEMTVTPAAEALVGDYSVAVQCSGQKSQSNLEFRVTVKASSVWGWVGVAIIVLVIAGLALIFRKLGRR